MFSQSDEIPEEALKNANKDIWFMREGFSRWWYLPKFHPVQWKGVFAMLIYIVLICLIEFIKYLLIKEHFIEPILYLLGVEFALIVFFPLLQWLKSKGGKLYEFENQSSQLKSWFQKTYFPFWIQKMSFIQRRFDEYEWRWKPISWEGYAAIFLYVLLVAVIIFGEFALMSSPDTAMLFVSLLIVISFMQMATSFLSFICFQRGE